MPNTLPAVAPGLYFYEIPARDNVPAEWVRAYTDGVRLWRLAPVGEGLPLADCLGAIMGPLVRPGSEK